MAAKNTKRKALTQKQEAFALAYFEGGNASEAYRAVYKPKKASAKTVNKRASELLNRGEIAGRVAALRARVEARGVLTLEKTLRRLARIINNDPGDFVDEKGNLRAFNDLGPDARAALAGFESFEEYEGRGEDREATGMVRKIKFIDVNPAIANAMRHFGAFEKDNKQKADPVSELFKWLNDRNAKTGSHGLPVKA